MKNLKKLAKFILVITLFVYVASEPIEDFTMLLFFKKIIALLCIYFIINK